MKSPRVTPISVKLDSLIALRRNPQYLTEKQMAGLVASIKGDGFLAPIVVRKKKKLFEVLSGNHRALASREAGLTEIPALLIDPCDDKRAARIAVNMNTVHGDPTPELLAPFLAEVDDETLRSIFIEDSLLKGIVEFDATLDERLKSLLLPDSLDRPSPVGTMLTCVCSCGHRHAPARKSSESTSSEPTSIDAQR